MSTDYQYDVLIGFAVPEDKLYDRESGSRWSCEHAEEQHSQDPSAKHCSECGKKISEVEESQLVLKPEIAALLADDWCGGVGWEKDLDGAGILLVQYDTGDGETASVACFAGVGIAMFYHREDLGIQREDVPLVPTEAEMAEFLNASGIPFDPESWGLWKIGTAH
jgi:hypothetical protein